MCLKFSRSLALALIPVLPAMALAVSETRKITIPSQQPPLPSIQTTSVAAFEHPTATHIPVEEISAISEIMEKEDELATEELDSPFLTASDE